MNIGNKLSVVKSAATSKAGLSLLRGRKHSPTILFAAGVIGFGATIVLASKATLKLDGLLEENDRKQGEVHDKYEISKLTVVLLQKADKEYKKDTAAIKLCLVRDIAVLYAPAVGVGILSVGALTGSHVILNRRYTSVVAAYATLDRSFKEYRGRVTELYGSEVDKKLVNGVVSREIISEDGSTVTTTQESEGRSPYAKLFAKDTTYEWSPQGDYNLAFLRGQQTYHNDQLHAKGYVFLNDVYKALGLELIPAGQSVGWFKNNPRSPHANCVDFGIFDDPDRFSEFMRAKEGALWLDFNVDGVIYDLI